MTLPAGHARHLVDRGALRLTQHGNHHVLLRGAAAGGSPGGSGSGSLSIADHTCSISAARSPTLRLFSTPGSAFHNARSRLPLSGAASSSSFDETTISPSLTAAGVSRHSAMPSLPMM